MDSGFLVCGFRISHPWIPDSLSGWIPDFKILFWIPDSISWIPDSKAVNSGFHRPELPGFRITVHGAIIKNAFYMKIGYLQDLQANRGNTKLKD